MMRRSAPFATRRCRKPLRLLDKLRRRAGDERGFAVLDAIFALIVFCLVMALVTAAVPLIQQLQKGMKMAGQMAVLSNGMHLITSQNYATWVGTGSHPVTVASLIACQCVPPSMPTTDPFGDAWVLTYNAGASQIAYTVAVAALPSTNQSVIDFISAQANTQALNGDAAGVVGENATLGQSTNWDTQIGTFAGLLTGAPAMTGVSGAASLINDNLYRALPPGHPEAVTMLTALNMGNQNITNGAVINGTVVNASTQVNSPMLADPTTPSDQITPAGASNISSLTVLNSITDQGTLAVTGTVVVSNTVTATEHMSP